MQVDSCSSKLLASLGEDAHDEQMQFLQLMLTHPAVISEACQTLTRKHPIRKVGLQHARFSMPS